MNTHAFVSEIGQESTVIKVPAQQKDAATMEPASSVTGTSGSARAETDGRERTVPATFIGALASRLGFSSSPLSRFRSLFCVFVDATATDAMAQRK